jgi:hypothetical protein
MKLLTSSLLSVSLVYVALPARGQTLFNDSTTLPGVYFTNYIQLVDLDGDEHLDIIAPNCSGFMSTGPQPLEVYRNDGAGNFLVYGFPLSAAKAVRQVGLGDIDRDGDTDVYVPDASTGPHFLFVNNGTGVFAEESTTRLPAGFTSRVGATEFGDFDNDGDLDLFVGDGYSQGSGASTRGHVLLNDGSGVFTMGTPLPAGTGADPIDVDLADVDRDWDLDILLNVHSGQSNLWLNDGSGVFTDATANVHPMEGLHYGPSLCDIDGDTDLDMLTDNAGPGLADTVATNDGMGVFTDMTASLLPGSTNNPSADDNEFVCVDIDHDGDFDAVVASLQTRERVLHNDGGSFTYVANQFPASSSDSTLWMDFGDLNSDGRLDVVTAQGEPSSYPNEVFLANTSMAVDAQAPKIIVVEQVGADMATDTPVVRYAVSDAVVTDMGPRLERAFVTVEADGAPQEVEAEFSGGDLFRAVLPAFAVDVVVTYTACAVDLQGNEGCGQPLSYTVGRPEPTGSGGAGGAGVGGSSSAGPGATSGAGGSDADDDEEGGCGCVVPGGAGESSGWLLLGLPVVGLWRRRSRSIKRAR